MDILPEKPAQPRIDTRTIGTTIIMFEDLNISCCSPCVFNVETPVWRKMQNKLQLGDYGGTFLPDTILTAIEKLHSDVEYILLSRSDDLALVYSDETGVDSALQILTALRKIAEVAKVAGTRVYVLNSQKVNNHGK